MSKSRSMRRKVRKKRVFRIILSLVLLSLIGGATFLAYNAKRLSDNVYQKVDDTQVDNVRTEDVKISQDPFNILLVGIEEQGGGERSDVLMLLTVDPELKEVYMVSIPRDTRTYIKNAGFNTKITESYSYGGIESTINAVDELLDIPIDYYVTTNFKGFEDVVNTLGGITVDVPFTFKAQLTKSLKWKTFHEGEMELNGNEALAYVRMRKSDPKGDAGRNERQQQVIKEIIDKGSSFSSITKIDNILDDLGNNVKTNIPPSKFASFISLYAKVKNSEIQQLTLSGKDEIINNIYYFIPDEESVNNVSTTLNSVLNNDNVTQSEVVSSQ